LHRLLILRLLWGLRRRRVLLLWHRRRGLRLLWLRVLRLLGLLGLRVLGSSLLAHGSALLRLGHGRKLTREDRPCLAGCANARLLRVQRQIELQAWLAAIVLLVLAGVEGSVQLLK
jgi:hypothetical protein